MCRLLRTEVLFRSLCATQIHHGGVMRHTNFLSKCFLTTIPLLVVLWGSSLAQTTGVITGTAIDTSATPMAGATIRIKNTKQGAVAKANGRFIIQNVEAGTHTLVISSVGMHRYEITVKVAPAETVNIGNCIMRCGERISLGCIFNHLEITPMDPGNQGTDVLPQEIKQQIPQVEATIE